MNKKMSLTLIAIGLGMSLSNMAAAQEKLIVYTSMKESLIGALKAKFTEKHPDVEMDYQSAGAGKLMAKIATEKESGKIMADVIWTSEVPDFFQMKKNGMLEAYVSPETANIVNPIPNFDGSFTPIRLGTLAIAYNTRFVKDNPPAEWADILKPEYKGAFGIANPALSGTSYMSVSLLKDKFGWEFFEKLKSEIVKYDAFTDIEFNPKKSINCQARSAALYVWLFRNNMIDKVLKSRESYMEFFCDSLGNDETQLKIDM
ncbi:extracellular solute-binding protein [uncultured Haemophilus sp.]|uniref:DarT1-associated NADAR antitoxin family protein n=1 Tax=uncultured Haemophilus sp. TaxID=237779 RepID=UPI0025F93C26|nr:extracellular solute-binding protein [uncultured Haemophilus sp.]